MRTMVWAVAVTLGVGWAAGAQERPAAEWANLLARRVQEYGHRNWIVIADSAYPSQTRAGIETVATGAAPLEVVQEVLNALAKAKHVRPLVYLDAELAHVPEGDAPGVNAYRDGLRKVLGNRPVRALPHEEILEELDRTGEKFRVLVLKTNLTIPYTSVFLELDCGYWGPEAERRLRSKLKEK